ncbi:MAG: hypothetical protein O3A36_03375 [bacterium]|nr:hypothetical protein [bacterium]
MNRKNTVYAFLLALCITIIWTSFNRYEYIGNNLYLFNTINVFPLVLWTIGLTILYTIHTNIKTKHPLIIITILYLVCLFALEAFGYYVLNIRLNSNYPSLFNMGIIHAPVHMKVFYVVIGPIYIMATDFLLKARSYRSA